MTHLVNISLSYTSSQELLISAESAETQVTAYSTFSNMSSDLIHELRGGRSTQRALKQSQEIVSEILFAGEVGNLLQNLLTQSPPTKDHIKHEGEDLLNLLIILKAPDELHAWPWELALAPQSDTPLLLNQVEIIRIAGNQLEPSQLSDFTVHPVTQVITKASEMFKFSAMRAATAHISRNYQVKVGAVHTQSISPLSPQERNLIHHLYAVDKQGVITLDDHLSSALNLGESTFARESYLLNITPRVSYQSVLAARKSGALAIIARQFEQNVKLRAESDRALYHALGAGKSILDAVHWVRKTLAKSDPHGYQWATITLTSCQVSKDQPIVTWPFPPPKERLTAQKSQHTEDQTVSSHHDTTQSHKSSADINDPQRSQYSLSEGMIKLAYQRRTYPTPASQFVKDTVSLIQQSQRTQATQDKIALALRTPVMRHLSELVQTRKILPHPKLSRSAQLSRQLIEASLSPDQELSLPSQWLGRVERLTSSIGLQLDAVAQASRALIASPAVWISGTDSLTRLLLARGLCEEVFNALPLEPLHAIEHLSETPNTPQEDANARFMTGIKTITDFSWNFSWSTESIISENGSETATKIDPLEAQSADIFHDKPLRQLMVGYQTEREAWRPYERVWLVIDHAEEISLTARRIAHQALRSGTLSGNRGQTHAIPKDFRIIYLGDSAPHDLREDGEVIVHLNADLELLPQLWTQRLRVDLQERAYQLSEIDTRVTSPATQSLMMGLCLALELNLTTPTRAYDALSYGVLMGGSNASCSEAVELYLDSKGYVEFDCLIAYLSLDQERYEICWRSIFSTEPTHKLPMINLIAKGEA